jgi:pimeloyl-ACP methyl ester carboxylesterase
VKFTSLTREWMKATSSGVRTHSIVPNAGHRVPWDAPVQFRAILANFLSRW